MESASEMRSLAFLSNNCNIKVKTKPTQNAYLLEIQKNLDIYSNTMRLKIICSFSFLAQELPSELGKELSN